MVDIDRPMSSVAGRIKTKTEIPSGLLDIMYIEACFIEQG